MLSKPNRGLKIDGYVSCKFNSNDKEKISRNFINIKNRSLWKSLENTRKTARDK